MTLLILCLGVTLACMFVIGGAAAVVLRRSWEGRPGLAAAVILAGIGVMAHLAWAATWAGRAVAYVLTATVLAASTALCVRGRVWRGWSAWLPLAAATGGVLALHVGAGLLWGGAENPFQTAQQRYLSALPPDNALPYMFALNVWNGESTTAFFGDWNGSDRPPLQSGLILLLRPLWGLTGVPDDAGHWAAGTQEWAIAASVTAQLAWTLGVYALVRVLSGSRRLALLTVAFVAVLPLAVHNTFFTWPKLMSAGFLVASAAVLISGRDGDRPRGDLALAAGLAALGLMSHGGGAFFLPVIAGLAWTLLRGRPLAVQARSALLSLLVVGVVFLPWSLYGRIADPSHGRLVKYHLANVTQPNDDSTIATIIRAYSDASLTELLDARLANLHSAFATVLWPVTDLPVDWVDRWRNLEFFMPFHALGLAGPVLGAYLVTLVASRWRRSVAPSTCTAGPARELVLLTLVSVVLWALLMFAPHNAVVHVGAYASFVCLAVVPFLWLADSFPRAAVALVPAQAVAVAVVDGAPSTSWDAVAHLAVPAVLLVVVGVVLLVVSVAVARDEVVA